MLATSSIFSTHVPGQWLPEQACGPQGGGCVLGRQVTRKVPGPKPGMCLGLAGRSGADLSVRQELVRQL